MAHRRFLFALRLIAMVATAACIFASGARAAPKEMVIYSFTDGSDGADPTSPLTLDSAGNLYGEAGEGTGGYGVVFELQPLSTGRWKEATFYAFGDGGINGSPSRIGHPILELLLPMVTGTTTCFIASPEAMTEVIHTMEA